MVYKFPLDLDQVADVVKGITYAYLRDIRMHRRTSSDVIYWGADSIENPNDSNVYQDIEDSAFSLYSEIFRRRMEDVLKSKAKDFAMAINGYSGGELVMKTRIFNISLLKDILDGRTIPDIVRDYTTGYWAMRGGMFSSVLTKDEDDRFMDILNNQMRETERRLLSRMGFRTAPPPGLERVISE